MPALKRSSPATRRSRKPVRKHAKGLRLRLALIGVAVVGGLIVWAVVARAVAPRGNTVRTSFDAIVVLGTPADSDGNPTPDLLDRVSEGVREYERGVAPRIIFTGGAAHNHFVEASVMARVAEAQGVPASVIVQENEAKDTIQNACYSERIMKAHGWRSAEVISSGPHLARVSIIFGRLHAEFRTHAAPPNLTSAAYGSAANVIEVIKTARYLVWSRWVESCSE